MPSLRVDIDSLEWTSGLPFYGPGARYEGKDLVQLKILCDRRAEGGGISWIARFLPPPGKLIKIVAVALSDEHVFGIQGGRTTKSGQPVRAGGAYSLNTKGQPHSAVIATETTSLIVYTGEPDDVRSMEVLDIAAAG
jgi:hypothetical protein